MEKITGCMNDTHYSQELATGSISDEPELLLDLGVDLDNESLTVGTEDGALL
jgi:hypothetical protein